MGRKRNKNVAKDDVNAAEVAMEKAVRRVQVILREHSEEEIRETLLQCNLNHNVAIDRLLSLQDASDEQGASNQSPDSSTTTSSIPVPNQSDLQNRETRDVPVSSGEVVPLSSETSSSAITNGETRSVPVSSNVSVPPLSVTSSRSVPTSSNPSLFVPSSRALTNVKPKRQASRMMSASDPSMAEVLRGLHKKPDVTNRSSNSLTESDAARRDHLQESALLISNPQCSGEVVSLSSETSSSDLTNGETRSVQSRSNVAVHSLYVPSSSDVTNGETRTVPISLNPSLSVPSSSAITNGETRSVPVSSNLSVLPSSRALTNVKPKREDTRMISASGPPMDEVLRGLHVPSKQNVTKAPVKADSPLLHQKPDATNPVFNSFTESDAAKDPQHSSFHVNQPMDTRQQSIATAFGTYPSSEPHNNQQGMNHFKSLVQVPSGQYGNMINSPYWRPNQNESYDMAPSAASFQQRGNSNTLVHHDNMMSSPDTWLGPDIYQSLDSVFAPYRNRTLPLSATSTVPSSHGSAYDFGNAANSRLGYEDVPRNHLPSNSSSTSSIGPSHASAYGFDMSGGSIPRVRLPSNRSGTSSIGLSSHVNGSNSRLGYGDYLPHPATSSVPSSHVFDMSSGNAANLRFGYEDVSGNQLLSNSSGGASIVLSSHGSAFGFDMTSGNDANSRLGYEDVSRSHFPSNSIGSSSHVSGSNSRLGYGDYLPPVHHQGISPSVWRAQAEDSYRSLPPHSLQEPEAYFERNRAYLASLDHGYNRNDPSDQTKQRPRDKS